MECSQVYDLFTTKDLDIQRNNSQLKSNFGVLLEAAGELLGQMVEKTVLAGNSFVVFVAKRLVEKLEWLLVEAVGTDLGLPDLVVGTHCLKDQPF